MKTPVKPPRWPGRILQWWSSRGDIEDMIGDLEEEFLINIERKNLSRAHLILIIQVISLIFSYGLKKRKSAAAFSPHYRQNSIAMLHNYFKIALRSFSKHKLFTSLNIIGLALGMSICLLALSIAVAIYRSDEGNELKNRLYQVNTYIETVDETKTYASSYHALGNYLTSEYPFIEQVTRIQSNFSPVFDRYGNNLSFHGYYADPNFIETFDFQMIHGNVSSALLEPYSLVLTQSAAEKIFNEKNPIGEILTTANGKFTVTGVISDLKQTHHYFEVLTSYATYEQLKKSSHLSNDWKNYRNNYLYVLLKNKQDKTNLNQALNQAALIAEDVNENQSITFETVTLTEVVPRWNIRNALGIGWDQPSILFFMFIGLLVLLPAVFNYTNLSIARALKRAKEIGIRKVVGADNNQIKAQFFVETILITLLALIGSIMIFIPLKEEFLNMVIAAEVLDTSMGVAQITVFILFTLLIGVVAGIFPARFFARLNPVHTLKGAINEGKVNVSGIKKGLFVFQFFLSLVFIIGVGTIAKQYAYVLNSNHGFNADNILSIPLQGIDKQVAINELSQHPDIKAITTASNLPGNFINTHRLFTPNGLDSIYVKEVFISDNFLKNMDMKLAWGSSQQLKNSNQTEENVLVNQEFLTATSVFNLQKDSLQFTLADGTYCNIIGVLDDLNYEPLSEERAPLMMRYSLPKSQYALLTVNSPNIKKTINELDAIWRSIDQNINFAPSFLDDEIEKSYYFLQVQIKIFTFLSVLAITISCLGLLGMVVYTTENRTKEIAIRKILGASDTSLYVLLTRDFVKLILVSAAFAVPFSYFFYDKLFLYFLIKYGLGLGFVEVIGGILLLFLIGFASIYWQTSRVAKTNPANNLRYE